MSLNYVALKNLHAQIIAWLEQGIPQKAKKKLDELTFEEKDNLFVEYLQGICEQELGNRERAVRHFKYVISQDPGFVRAAEALFHLAEDSLSIGEKKYLAQIIHLHRPKDKKITEFLEENQNIPSELILKPLQASDAPVLLEDDELPEKADSHIPEIVPAPEIEMIEEEPVEEAVADEPKEEMSSVEMIENTISDEEAGTTREDESPEIPVEPAEEPEKAAFSGLDEAETAAPAMETEAEPETESAKEPQPVEEEMVAEIIIEAEATESETEEPEEEPVSEEKTAEPAESAAESNDVSEKMPEDEEKNPRRRTKTQQKIINIETQTMAQIYRGQGFYEEALNILEKLKDSSMDPDRIQQEINELKKLKEEKKNQ